MEESLEQEEINRKVSKVITFTIPFDLVDFKENISFKSNASSKEQVINQAIRLHSEKNFSEAAKYYQFCLDQD